MGQQRADQYTNPHLIACEVFRDEFEAVVPPGLARTYLPQGLHRTPGKMPAAIQEVVDTLPADVGLVIMGYGLCSNGIVGVTAGAAPIVAPKVHDCIALLLGSRERYEAEVSACPGTYYITAGWAKYGKTSLTAYKEEYLPKYGEEDARYIAEECLKHYTRVALINHGAGDLAVGRAHAQEFAETFGMTCVEISGSLDYLRRLVRGPWEDGDFLVLPPGTSVSAEPFMALHSISLP